MLQPGKVKHRRKGLLAVAVVSESHLEKEGTQNYLPD